MVESGRNLGSVDLAGRVEAMHCLGNIVTA